MPGVSSASVPPDPVKLLNVWLALEALQPQSFSEQAALLGKDVAPSDKAKRGRPLTRALFNFDLASGVMPWETRDGDRRNLNIEDDERITWHVPLGFVRMTPAVERLVSKVEPSGPEREEASGVSILALAAFDEEGRALPSKLLLSSFGWACGEVLAGRLDQLHRFVDVEEELRQSLGESLVAVDVNGLRAPTTKTEFLAGMTTVMSAFGLPADLLERPRHAIRLIGDIEPIEMINSFYLRDLHRVRTALAAGDGGSTLKAYLGQDADEDRHDVLADKAVLEALVAPGATPPMRWPTPPPARLVTLQQAAVNAAVRDLAEGGLLSINGPPGTGKTTLLRDVVAAVIGRRADALAAFEDPTAAFSPVELVAEGGRRRLLHRLDPSLRGHGMVVASSNNTAVRNVSAELPLAEGVDPALGLSYFAGVAQAVRGDGEACWGLIAAVLGNRANRSEFVEQAWWNPEWGLEKYLGVAAGRPLANAPPPVVVAEKPPSTRAQAQERWRKARLEYQERRAEALRLLAEREQLRWALTSSAGLQQAMEDAAATQAEAIAAAEAAEDLGRESIGLLAAAETVLADARRLVDGGLAVRPGVLARLLGGDAGWRETQARALEALRLASEHHRAAADEARRAEARRLQARAEAEAASAAAASAAEQLAALQALARRAGDLYPEAEIGPAFWSGGHAEIHTASPWADPIVTQARDRLFAAAVGLHRAFVDAAARPMKSNLGLVMDHLKGRRIPSGAAEHLGELWDSLFLVVPVVSTTFASLDRLMSGMAEKSLGWLIVDEAGQATPQAAAGGLWRAQRALVIGDPLQIEPISTLPTGLVRAICDSHGAHPDIWAAPRASTQTLADAAGSLMAHMGAGADRRAIGMPLLVHRRCQDPMFSISNEIAYGGLMVHKPGSPDSPIRDALASIAPGSAWLDVLSDAEKWSPQEGAALVTLLERLAEQGVKDPDLYVIAPFREVADRLRSMLVRSEVLVRLGIAPNGRRAWGERRVGTVHTFQGKEAEAVFLVLGASAESSRGSRDWAGATPNILNVAATRAKKAFYVIGKHDAWRRVGVFAAAADALPVVSLAASRQENQP